MFNIPGFGHHPIKPVSKTSPESSNGELESVPTLLTWMAFIVSSVTSVVSNHGPSGEGPGGKTNNGNEVNAESHGQHSNGSAEVGPSNDFIEVADIIVSLFLFKSFSEFLDFLSKGFNVEGWDPLVSLLQLFSISI